MKKATLVAALLATGMMANAQVVSKFSKPQDTYTLDASGNIVKKKALFKSKKERPAVDPKYLEGAVTEVNGKVAFDQDIKVEGKSAKEIYDAALNFLMMFCKGKEMTELSNVSVVNETDHVIGSSIQEWLVFENRPLSLDQTKFNYQLIVTCTDGNCHVQMRHLSYIYEEERGGGRLSAEDMISDKEALNKAKDGFQRGGSKKFRTKTIDRKDQVFAALAEAVK